MPLVEVVRAEYLSDNDLGVRELQCWAYWRSLSSAEQRKVVKLVSDEMRRLADSVESWLPAAMRKVNGGYSLRITIYPDDLLEGGLSPAEINKVLTAIETMSDILDE